jgi:hypothetical protein
MPRTEHDLDVMMTAIERHKGEGSRLGELYASGKLDASAILDQAAHADNQLYNILDIVQEEREKEVGDADDDQEG